MGFEMRNRKTYEEFFPYGYDFRYEGITVRVPWTDKQSIGCLIKPYTRQRPKSKCRSQSRQAPSTQQHDEARINQKHLMRRDLVALLEPPECVDADTLGCDSDDEEVGELEGGVGDDGILESADDCDGCVEAVSEEEVGHWG